MSRRAGTASITTWARTSWAARPLVYSRCVRPTRPQSGRSPLRACDLKRGDTGRWHGAAASVATAIQRLAPAIWGVALVFGRRRASQRRAEIVLWRPGRPLQRLGAGSLPSCSQGGRRRSPPGLPVDIGPGAAGRRLQLGADRRRHVHGLGAELRIARLDGSRARIAGAGWSDGTCGTITRSPERLGPSALFFGYGYSAGCGGDFFVRFDLNGAQRFKAPVPTESRQVSVAWDGDSVYWIGKPVGCRIVRTRRHGASWCARPLCRSSRSRAARWSRRSNPKAPDRLRLGCHCQ